MGKEARECVYEIKDCLPHVVESLLCYMYTGKLDVQEDGLEQLLSLAAEYQVEAVCSEVAEALVDTISISNVPERVRILTRLKDHEVVAPWFEKLVCTLQKDKALLKATLWGIV